MRNGQTILWRISNSFEHILSIKIVRNDRKKRFWFRTLHIFQGLDIYYILHYYILYKLEKKASHSLLKWYSIGIEIIFYLFEDIFVDWQHLFIFIILKLNYYFLLLYIKLCKLKDYNYILDIIYYIIFLLNKNLYILHFFLSRLVFLCIDLLDKFADQLYYIISQLAIGR